ncbi:peptidyl-tRNA hydrolase [Actinokineospora sp.]|uniref:peptidyl-tRNA hydrolase n=1 Tax=Actinokineospora sp. TaxID=1872133 RepID=UPI004037C8D2
MTEPAAAWGGGSILAPLAASYASWLALPAAATREVADEDPALVRAMPVVLRIERDAPPARTSLLAAAASAALAVCLDPRAGPEGPWHDDVREWVSGSIRKVARRARATHWAAVRELPGVTIEVDGAEARALVPVRVADTPREVARLQISGSELPDDDPGPPPPGVPVLWCNPEVPMTAGKAAAQVGHATMLLAAVLATTPLTAWADSGFRCAVRTPSAHQWKSLLLGDDPDAAWRSRRVLAVRDAGFTEVAPGTVTILAQWP